MSSITCKHGDNSCVLLRVNGEWIPYKGTTSLRKLYYRAYEADRFGSSSFYVWEYSWEYSNDYFRVTGAIFPNKFYKHLSCTSINGVEAHNLPHMIVLDQKPCNIVALGNGCGSICTHCGDRS